MAKRSTNLRHLAHALSAEGPVFLLETQAPWQGVSFLAAQPTATLAVYGNHVRVTDASGRTEDFIQNPWDALRDFRRRHASWVFCGLGYDLKNADENLSSRNPDLLGLPDLFAICPGLLLREGQGGTDVLIGKAPALGTPRAMGGSRVRNLRSADEKDSYLDRIRRVKHDIHEGEYYELNLSHPILAQHEGSAMDLYETMASRGPVPMAAFCAMGEVALCCASPERYLRRQGTVVASEPIKGTRPRSADPHEDARLLADLRDSEKDRAENLMIVDLVRNDLSRVALPGTVETSLLFELRSFATVHQMVSTVQAQVAPDLDPVDILRATFPMGSMTGAPKIRVMEAIERYETYRRGLYSGAVGYITPAGDFDFNVVIRTALLCGDRLVYPVGGAITSDSDPEAEWDETWVKAKALGIEEH